MHGGACHAPCALRTLHNRGAFAQPGGALRSWTQQSLDHKLAVVYGVRTTGQRWSRREQCHTRHGRTGRGGGSPVFRRGWGEAAASAGVVLVVRTVRGLHTLSCSELGGGAADAVGSGGCDGGPVAYELRLGAVKSAAAEWEVLLRSRRAGWGAPRISRGSAPWRRRRHQAAGSCVVDVGFKVSLLLLQADGPGNASAVRCAPRTVRGQGFSTLET